MGIKDDNIYNVIEEIAPGYESMDRSWTADFWELFTECLIGMDACFVIVFPLLTFIANKTINIMSTSMIAAEDIAR